MPVGRRRVLDDVKRREVCALISAGCSVNAAAHYVGCNPSTIRREASRNEDFHEMLRRAELAAELQPLESLQKAAATHWRAAAWFLERTRPGRFARYSPSLIKVETAQELMGNWLDVIAEELPNTPECAAAYRRLELARQDTCRELTAAAAVSRDPKRLRKIIAKMSARSDPPQNAPQDETKVSPVEAELP